MKSQNDREALKAAHNLVYLKGFYEGVLEVGKYKGMKVQVAKVKVRDDMIQSGEAELYSEPESEVISRSGDTCVVSFGGSEGVWVCVSPLWLVRFPLLSEGPNRRLDGLGSLQRPVPLFVCDFDKEKNGCR